MCKMTYGSADLYSLKAIVWGLFLALVIIGGIIFSVSKAFADGVVKVDGSTIAVTKTDNIKLNDANSQLIQLAREAVYFQKQADAALAEKAIINAKIDEILQNFQSVGIDLVDPR